MSATPHGLLAGIGAVDELFLLSPAESGGYAPRTLLNPEAEPAPPLVRSPASFCWPVWTADGQAILISTLEHAAPGEPGALLLRCPVATGTTDVLYRNPPGSTPMAGGLPHYVNPSPDSQHVLLLMQAPPAGLALVFLDALARGPAQMIARGAPLFSAWSPGSDAVLLHVGGELSLMELATAPSMEVFATNHVGYRVPAWSPDGRSFAVSEMNGRRHSLVLRGRNGKTVAALAPSWSSTAFAWSPDGELIAQAQSRRTRPQAYTDLQLVSVAKGGARPTRVSECELFVWSPSGEHLAVLVPNGMEPRAHWLIVDRDGAPVRRFPAFQPSAEFVVYKAFFDQYLLSHRLWSPDGAAILGFGRMAQEGIPPELLPSCIYVHDLAAGEVSVAGTGSVAFWSRQT